jgi:hypothetical protein
MAGHPDADRAPIPLSSLVFGYGPMAPFAAAALGAWTLAAPWPVLATRLAIVWGAIILVFVAGVRRGYGFGAPEASTAHEIATMLVYFGFGGLSLVLADVGRPAVALALLVVGFVLAPVFDRRAAFAGDAPPYFASLRGPQMAIAAAALVALLAHLLLSAPNLNSIRSPSQASSMASRSALS